MARPRKGAARQRGTTWYAGINLRSGRKHEWPVRERPDGLPLNETWVRAHSLDMQARYDRGQWDPEAPVAVVAPTAPLDVTTLAREWYAQLTNSSRLEDEREVERTIATAPIGAMAVAAVELEHCIAHVRWLQARPSARGGTLAPRTVRTAFGVLQRVFEYARIRRLVAVSPCKLPRRVLPVAEDKHPGQRAGWVFTAPEVWALAFDGRLAPARRVRWALLGMAGPRGGEVAILPWSRWVRDATPRTKLLVVESIERETRERKSTKARKQREVPVCDALEEVLAWWWREGWAETYGRAPTPDDLVVPSESMEPGRVNHWNADLADDLATLGLRRRHTHCLRRSFITLARDAGADVADLRRVTHGASKSMDDAYDSPPWARSCRVVDGLRFEAVAPPRVTAVDEVSRQVTRQALEKARRVWCGQQDLNL